jgi:3'-phosphoadenosine 5'-phosphosulfate sulfotransferase
LLPYALAESLERPWIHREEQHLGSGDMQIKDRSMAKMKRKLTQVEKAARKRHRLEYMTVFLNGKQKRVKRPPTINGMDIEQFIAINAGPIWLQQTEMWEYMDAGNMVDEP